MAGVKPATVSGVVERLSKWSTSISQYLHDLDVEWTLEVGDAILHSTDQGKAQSLYRIHKIEYDGSSPAIFELVPYHPERRDFQISLLDIPSIRVQRIDEANIVNTLIPNEILAALPQVSTDPLIVREATVHELLGPTESVLTACSTCAINLRRDLPAIGAPPGEGRKPQPSHEDCDVLAVGLTRVVKVFGRLSTAVIQVLLVLSTLARLLAGTVQPPPATTSSFSGTQSSMQVQDIEATPVKSRPVSTAVTPATPAATVGSGGSAVARLVSVAQQLRSFTEQHLIPLLDLHPLPHVILTKDFVRSLEGLLGVNSAAAMFASTLQAISRTDSSTSSINSTITLVIEVLQDRLSTSVEALRQRAASAILDFQEQSCVLHILRQDWTSDSQYHRDKKVTHGVTSLCCSLRSTIWDIYEHRPVLLWGQERLYYSATSKVCLQLLLTTAVQVCRTYTGSFTDTEPSGEAAASAGSHRVERWVNLSRVRTAQWRRDISCFVHCALDTLVWLLNSDCQRMAAAVKMGNTSTAEENTPAAVFKRVCDVLTNHQLTALLAESPAADVEVQTLLDSPVYADQVEIIGELLLVLRYLLLCLYVAGTTDVDALLGELSAVPAVLAVVIPGSESISSSTHQAISTHADNPAASSKVWDQLQGLLAAVSGGQRIADILHIPSTGTRNDSDGKSVPARAGAYCTTSDIVSGSGFYPFRAWGEEEEAIYRRELTAGGVPAADISQGLPGENGASSSASASAVAKAQAAVWLHRVSNLVLTDSSQVLALLKGDAGALVAVLREVNESSSSDPPLTPEEAVRRLIGDMLRRRYEIVKSNYPPLNALESAAAEKIGEFLVKQHL